SGSPAAASRVQHRDEAQAWTDPGHASGSPAAHPRRADRGARSARAARASRAAVRAAGARPYRIHVVARALGGRAALRSDWRDSRGRNGVAVDCGGGETAQRPDRLHSVHEDGRRRAAASRDVARWPDARPMERQGRARHRRAVAVAREPAGPRSRHPRAGARGRPPQLLSDGSAVTGVMTLVWHSLRRWRALFGATALVLVAFQFFIVLAARNLELAGQFKLLEAMLPAFMTRLSNMMAASFIGFVLFGYSHPLVQLFLVATAIGLGSEPAAEIDTKVVDLLMSRPLPPATPINRTLIMLMVTTIGAIVLML